MPTPRSPPKLDDPALERSRGHRVEREENINKWRGMLGKNPVKLRTTGSGFVTCPATGQKVPRDEIDDELELHRRQEMQRATLQKMGVPATLFPPLKTNVPTPPSIGKCDEYSASAKKTFLVSMRSVFDWADDVGIRDVVDSTLHVTTI